MKKFSKVLVTGLNGFTGKYLEQELLRHNYNCFGLCCDLRDKTAVKLRVAEVKPDFVIHLAAVSYVGEKDASKIYDVNVVGTTNLLEALSTSGLMLRKVILASSATVYSNTVKANLHEMSSMSPNSHYACSKLSMEYMAKNFFEDLPIIITRPFNYTGIGHSENFFIPKMISAVKNKLKNLEVGDISVLREFNDVRDICVLYRLLLESQVQNLAVNLCSGQSYTLSSVIDTIQTISGHKFDVSLNQQYLRANEAKDLKGCTKKLNSLVSTNFQYQLSETLSWMLER